ncbi:MAG: 1-(5-phosphoribosyl)-5-((5-phosphoribosylamino)methylideneamino)imidazole-4-carboxamide isomerase [Candidatus Hydrogenedentes bacterium]|nr:1-(5-phosphoribosyl)-5-((5-phosphoribosylamino)methylideneamino)imidazole-4-carboxamide isomerase [Candidatus Hydrogenedentota bacterium]
MRIVPAVDIRGGFCVNLVQGDYAQETVFSEDPVAQGRLWWQALKESLPEADFQESIVHIVDLDGAKSGVCCVLPQLQKLSALQIRYEVGGGIRTLESIAKVLGAGAERVILGTAAYREPELLVEACSRWPGRIVVGIDARNGYVSLSGWLEDTDCDALEFARTVEAAGASRIIYTDILSDGMLAGPNIETTGTLARSVQIPVTISGGVSALDDIYNARVLVSSGVDEIIIGRALYVRQFTVAQAVAAARERS